MRDPRGVLDRFHAAESAYLSTVVATAGASGADISHPLLQVVTLSEDRIARIEPFSWDTHSVLQTLSKGTG